MRRLADARALSRVERQRNPTSSAESIGPLDFAIVQPARRDFLQWSQHGGRGFRARRKHFFKTAKKPARTGFLMSAAIGCEHPGRKAAAAAAFSDSEGLDVAAQARFMARRFVLVDQATARRTVKHRLGCFVGGFGGGLVLRGDRVDDLLDGGTQRRARARVAGVALDGLTRTLLRGFDVCQGETPVVVDKLQNRASCRGLQANCRSGAAPRLPHGALARSLRRQIPVPVRLCESPIVGGKRGVIVSGMRGWVNANDSARTSTAETRPIGECSQQTARLRLHIAIRSARAASLLSARSRRYVRAPLRRPIACARARV